MATKQEIPKKKINILYGSKSGNTWTIAETLGKRLVEKGHEVFICTMNEYEKVNLSDTNSYQILMTSTVDYGNVPQNAEFFLLYLKSLKTNPFLHTKFAMFGLGDSEYKQYQFISWEIHDLMIKHGAHEFAEFTWIDEQY